MKKRRKCQFNTWVDSVMFTGKPELNVINALLKEFKE